MEENRAPGPGPEPQLPPAAQTRAQQGPECPHTSGSKTKRQAYRQELRVPLQSTHLRAKENL